jgi:hypothetical protein
MYVKITCVRSSALINALLRHRARTVSSAIAFAERNTARSCAAANGLDFNSKREIHIKFYLPYTPGACQERTPIFCFMQLKAPRSAFRLIQGFYI